MIINILESGFYEIFDDGFQWKVIKLDKVNCLRIIIAYSNYLFGIKYIKDELNANS